MKKDIHPQVNKDTQVTCACGNSFTTISTLPEISVDICSNCHPFFTGQQKFIDTEGRIEKFQKKMEAVGPGSAKKKKKGKKTQGKSPQSLKDMLSEARKNQ
ncbi:50S ribosomal protein L31 [candidate division WWE3 bacterium]|jgi:large subunit ribosomal protein L31|nr:50S ribosomal protein L31 [candidate division WWE3 bacterium]MBT7350714.1 50S ribosomal protein L31 [candidate division WWE3 bacterium]